MILISNEGIFIGPTVCKFCGESFEHIEECYTHIEEAHLNDVLKDEEVEEKEEEK